MKRVTIKDIAREAKTSYVTVSHYLNKRDSKFSDDTAQRIEAAIKKLGYIPNRMARKLARKRSYTIGVVLPPLPPSASSKNLLRDNPFYTEFLSGVYSKAWEYDYDVLTTAMSVPEAVFEWIVGYQLDGVVLFTSGIARELVQLAEKREMKLDTVLVGLDHTEAPVQARVLIDDEDGTRQAVAYLVSQGHRRIGFATGEYTLSRVNAIRLMGYQKALEASGIPFDETMIFVDEVSLEGGMRIGKKIATFKPSQTPTAVVCVADILAIGIIKACVRVGRKIPADLSVVGFDDLVVSSLVEPELTTIRQDIVGRGETCVQVIEDFYQGKYHPETVLPVDLVIRQSVASISGHR
ncbi:LacI family DNA-binding transcriptional regulator [Thermospira aquatica]|uniref:LacI family DNA-binding transcriptional regulator n=1 Tax=Thermospira aquatica TaxID=2828656 RepID=A0AAX3BFW3_9SPIR|nr:LacI family DNA-binding transcriptional regulator [Thermospira aquatica]URA11207.1 LacI family DNA-binding transcriptional regulator [Thermospira aquatica]